MAVHGGVTVRVGVVVGVAVKVGVIVDVGVFVDVFVKVGVPASNSSGKLVGADPEPDSNTTPSMYPSK